MVMYHVEQALVFLEEACAYLIISVTVIVTDDLISLQPFGHFLGSFLLTNEHLFNTRKQYASTCFFCLCWFQSPSPEIGESWCIDLALSLDYPVVNGCSFVACLVLFACMEAMNRYSAMPCLPELLERNLAPLPADKLIGTLITSSGFT